MALPTVATAPGSAALVASSFPAGAVGPIADVLLQLDDVVAFADAIFVFVLSLLVGTVAILAGARLIVDSDAGVANAAFTALIGAVVWAVASQFVGWIPIVGAVVMLLVWIGVINWRYPGGWGSAVAIGVVAWAIAVGIVYGAAIAGVVEIDVFGIPGA